jgi:hypothetical protein
LNHWALIIAQAFKKMPPVPSLLESISLNVLKSHATGAHSILENIGTEREQERKYFYSTVEIRAKNASDITIWSQ